ncbi:hypothetical protein ACTFIY_009622 [Dictyostelium cf. discoideum]
MFYTVVAFIAYYIWLYRSVIVKLAYNLKLRYKLNMKMKQAQIKGLPNDLLLTKEAFANLEGITKYIKYLEFRDANLLNRLIVEDSANDAFKSRAEEQENEFLTQGRKVIHIYSQLVTYAKGLLETAIIDNTLVYAETINFAKNGLTSQQLGNKVTNFINVALKNYSNIVLNEITQGEKKN